MSLLLPPATLRGSWSGSAAARPGPGTAAPPLSSCFLTHRRVPGPAEKAARRPVPEHHGHLPVLGNGHEPPAPLPAAGRQLESAVQEDPPRRPPPLQPLQALPPAASLPPAQGEVSTPGPDQSPRTGRTRDQPGGPGRGTPPQPFESHDHDLLTSAVPNGESCLK